MELGDFLHQIVFPIADIPENLTVKLLTPDNLKIWQAAFTHESVNRNTSENYDQFEKLGDAVLKTSYVNFLLHKYPTLNSSQLSSLSAHYLSKPILADISRQLSLGKYLRISVSHSLSTNEDLFESLIGALFWIGNLVGYGKGFIISDQFVRNIFSQIPVDMSITKGPPKTQLKEIFEALRWGKPIQEWKESRSGKPGVFTIRYTPEAMTFLRDQGLSLLNNILSTADGPTKKVASFDAHVEALNRLADLGITREWADEYHRRLEMNAPELSPYLIAVEKKAQKGGYVNIYFQNITTNKEGRTVQLIGEKSNGTRDILAQVNSTEIGKPEDVRAIDIHKELLQKFISSK